ncbi:putative trans-2-enoyl-CoA reductase, mitochondrial [Wickerhamiella sorbophila]|uniref:enoyl-[acyl-carrier-protein] reductase n=1 Tax=Wickerhamiella sorbophila TaxID=45607 RepID=A0A2T0FJC4_9ASCO|nr:putative trans-2-enoyl-CoA reductase, mitochondrial [Wickerhamiella sorbophila]PRT55076.1 putative trans-2-enoyl-CoA reductase, mitochondrial [Wickerhamiella sorbophila]
MLPYRPLLPPSPAVALSAAMPFPKSMGVLRHAVRLQLRFKHTARSVVFSDYGPPKDVLRVIKNEVADPQESQVLLKLVAAPINPADINQVEGVYPSKPQFTKELGTIDPYAVGGNEGLFEVVQVGPDQETFKVGDWVLPASASFGTWTTYKLSDPKNLIRIGTPNGLDAVAAATVAVNPSTAYRMLSDFAALEPGDWFIQNGGNSGVGRQAIQLGRLWGYKSISVVRDRRDIDSLKQELLDLGADQVVTEEQIADKSIRHIIKDWTHGQDIKLALNCVGGRSAANIARQLGHSGQLVTYGGMSKQPVSLPTSLYIFKNIASRGFWMTHWTKEHAEPRKRMILDLLDMYRQNELKLTGIKTHAVKSDAEEKDFLEGFLKALGEPGKQVLLVDR